MRRALWLAAGLAITGCYDSSVASSETATEPPDEVEVTVECDGDFGEEPVSFEWSDAPGRDSVRELTESPVVRVESRLPASTDVDVQLVVDADGERLVHRLGRYTLEPGAPTEIAIDLMRGLPAELQYSAAARIEVARTTGELLSISSSRYFHPSPRGVWIYGADALRERFRGGDYAHRRADDGEQPDSVGVARVRVRPPGKEPEDE